MSFHYAVYSVSPRPTRLPHDLRASVTVLIPLAIALPRRYRTHERTNSGHTTGMVGAPDSASVVHTRIALPCTNGGRRKWGRDLFEQHGYAMHACKITRVSVWEGQTSLGVKGQWRFVPLRCSSQGAPHRGEQPPFNRQIEERKLKHSGRTHAHKLKSYVKTSRHRNDANTGTRCLEKIRYPFSEHPELATAQEVSP